MRVCCFDVLIQGFGTPDLSAVNGSTFDFRIVNVLGAGGSATAYRALDVKGRSTGALSKAAVRALKSFNSGSPIRVHRSNSKSLRPATSGSSSTLASGPAVPVPAPLPAPATATAPAAPAVVASIISASGGAGAAVGVGTAVVSTSASAGSSGAASASAGGGVASLTAATPTHLDLGWEGVAKVFRDATQRPAFEREIRAYNQLLETKNVCLRVVASNFPICVLSAVGTVVTSLQMADVASLCEAVAEMHKARVIHCDLRLCNLIRIDGRIRIIDFSAAVCMSTVRATERALSELTHSLTHSLIE